MEEKKRILLSVTGLSPQVVTETLYALYKQGGAMPDRIHILTTEEGRHRARLTLIKDAWLQRFYDDYRLPAPEFEEGSIHVLEDASGVRMRDIRTREDNNAVADCINEWIRHLTADSSADLHVSIAGGRKTMGFYAGYALSLYGRPQDRLSHVLVSADYESHPQFYYPTPYSKIIYANDPTRKPLDTRDAEVVLADIPFVRLRHGLDESLLKGKSSFSASVAKAQATFGPPHLVIDFKSGRLEAQGVNIPLGPADLAFYGWLASRQLSGKAAPHCPSEGAPEAGYAEEYLREYRRVAGEFNVSERTLEALREGMSKSFFEQRKSRVNGRIKKALGIHAEPYLIAATGRRPRTRYQIKLEQNQIDYQVT